MNLMNAMPRLGVLALVVGAFAVPAVALAEPGEVFTHEGVPIEEIVPIELSGSSSSSLASSPSVGVDCPMIHVSADLEAEGTGTVTGYDATECTLTHPEPALNGLTVDDDPINVKNWKIMVDKAKSLIFITNFHVTETITMNKVVIAELTVKGTEVLEIPKGETKKVKKMKVSGEGMTANESALEVEGELELNGETEVGIEE